MSEAPLDEVKVRTVWGTASGLGGESLRENQLPPDMAVSFYRRHDAWSWSGKVQGPHLLVSVTVPAAAAGVTVNVFNSGGAAPPPPPGKRQMALSEFDGWALKKSRPS